MEGESYPLNISSMLSQQVDIIQAIATAPSLLAEYIHYRGSVPIEFKGASFVIPPLPLIPYNTDLCCLLNKIQGTSSDTSTCRNLSVDALGPRGKVGIPYIIHSDNGEDLIVKVSTITAPYATYSNEPPTPISDLDTLAAQRCISDVKISTIRYLACDEFTNETLIAYTLNYLLSKTKLPALFVRHYQGLICSNDSEIFGLNIIENCDMGSLDRLADDEKFAPYVFNYETSDMGKVSILPLVNEEIVKQILSQLVVGLHILQRNFGFISGDLKAANVLVKSEPIDTEYMKIKLKAPFTCKIADYGKSSCMIRRTNGTALRFYNDNTLANAYLKVHPFAPDISEENGVFYYTIGKFFTSQIYTRTRHMGIPFYQSFDYYTILVSTLMIPSFYYMFFASEKLRKIFWDPIWVKSTAQSVIPFVSWGSVSDDADEVFKRIRQYVLEGKGRSITDAVNVLKGIKLKCSALTDVINAWTN